jgi:hypothetical protein
VWLLHGARDHREGWLLIAAFAAGLVIIVIQSVFYSELDAQLVTRASELGHRPPLEEYSHIQAQYAGNVLVEVMGQLLLGVPPFALLALAVARIRQSLQGAAPNASAVLPGGVRLVRWPPGSYSCILICPLSSARIAGGRLARCSICCTAHLPLRRRFSDWVR